MKYILLLLAFACGRAAEDSTVRIKIIQGDSTKPAGYTNYTSIRFMVDDSTRLDYGYDSSITIKGDTMKIIKMMLENVQGIIERQRILRKENEELRKFIRQNKDGNPIHFTNKNRPA